MLNSIRLCQALNEKICHDFAGTIGVIDNSIGLIKTIDYQEKATKLIQDSTNRLISYLEFYRYLYSLPSEGNKTSIAEINRLATNFLKSKNHNIELIFTRLYNTSINDHIAQIIVCLIVIASNNISKNRPLAKLAYAEEFEGDASPRTAAYSNVREDSSTASTYKLPAEVEFCKRSNAIIKVELEIQHDKFTGIKIVVIDTNLKLNPDKADILLGKRIIEDVCSNDLENGNSKQGVSEQNVDELCEYANTSKFCGTNSSKHSSITIENVHEYYTYYLITEYGYKLLVTPLIDSVEYNLLL
ncbi:MAG: palindromic element RPE1 domain-containing protein [Rickettsia endosymbiont of Pseudomimeciton antennatum]|nr:palindromic element RPE1 domain-containing protein [Rickettsia endosymbiont of Pseudomimeciton antennatum]MCC8398837.1 palindromic element RPE1 domain-containing protein [Rickettsia endosymbiont of Labidopullus appendiculatus]